MGGGCQPRIALPPGTETSKRVLGLDQELRLLRPGKPGVASIVSYSAREYSGKTVAGEAILIRLIALVDAENSSHPPGALDAAVTVATGVFFRKDNRVRRAVREAAWDPGVTVPDRLEIALRRNARRRKLRQAFIIVRELSKYEVVARVRRVAGAPVVAPLIIE